MDAARFVLLYRGGASEAEGVCSLDSPFFLLGIENDTRQGEDLGLLGLLVVQKMTAQRETARSKFDALRRIIKIDK